MLKDPSFVKVQYRTSANLAARIRIHAKYSTNPYGWFRWVFDHLTLPAESLVLDVGCGRADLWTENAPRVPAGLSLILADLSYGMLKEAGARLPGWENCRHFVNAVAGHLPLQDACLDAVIANHMLYHVPDVDAALREFARVLRPGGRVYAATNGRGHLQELRAEVLARNYGLDQPYAVAMARGLGEPTSFDLENGGDQLARHFANVRLQLYEDALEVTDAQPLVDYICSLGELPQEQVERVQAAVEQQVAARGTVHISKQTGLFEAQKPA